MFQPRNCILQFTPLLLHFPLMLPFQPPNLNGMLPFQLLELLFMILPTMINILVMFLMSTGQQFLNLCHLLVKDHLLLFKLLVVLVMVVVVVRLFWGFGDFHVL